MGHEQWLEQKIKIQRYIYAIFIGLTINQGSSAVLKAEGFA
jgi:hypothetical protein